ncbi:MSCRAMM family protein [Enterococcus sp. LJL51]|uniref:MSCRAMM family protein n=1 Tax=Enterococcus sp. LJL51 TaxID=3416656 RepID=UPI003CFBAC25
MKSNLKKKLKKIGVGAALLSIIAPMLMNSSQALAEVVSSNNYVSEWKLVTDNDGYLGFVNINGQKVGIIPQGVVKDSSLEIPDDVNGNLWACLQPLLKNSVGTPTNVYDNPSDIGLSVNLNRMLRMINAYGFTNNSVGKKYSDVGVLSDFAYMNAAMYLYENDLANHAGVHIDNVLGINEIPDHLNLMKLSEAEVYTLLKGYAPYGLSAALSSARSQDEWAKATAKAMKEGNKEDLTNSPMDTLTKGQTVTSKSSRYLNGENSIAVSDTNGVNGTVKDGKIEVKLDDSADLVSLHNKVVTFTALTDVLLPQTRAGIPPVNPGGEIGSGTLISKSQFTDSTQKMGIWSDPPFVKYQVKIIGTGEVKITKTDEKTGELVPNTEFEVKEVESGKVHATKTNEKGEAVIDGIIHDTKVDVTEKFVPAPYVLATNNTKSVIIQAGKTATVEFKNEKATGKSTLTKQDKTTESSTPLNPNYPLANAKYGFFKEDGTMLEEFTLSKDLTAMLDKLDLGVYYWQETVAPTGYVLDQTKHFVELTYKDQHTAVVVDNALSNDDVIRMNLDGQKLIQNETNEIFKNGVEFTLTNLRTKEKTVATTATVDDKKGYFDFSDLPLDNYLLEETKGIEGYKDIDPIEISHTYDKKSDSFVFTVKDQKSGNILSEETLTQLELSQGENVDLGTYTLKDKAVLVEKPKVGMSTQAHIGDGKTNTFTWGDNITFYDDLKITHENIPVGTERAYEAILVAVYQDGTQKDVWSSGKVDYKVTDKEITEKVIAEYDYKKDPQGTTYFWKEYGFNKPTEKEYEKDVEHNIDGKDKNQGFLLAVNETPKNEEPAATKGSFPNTGEQVGKTLTIIGLALLAGVGCGVYLLYKKKKQQTPTK